MCALVAGIATDANTVTLALTIRGIGIHEHLKEVHPVMQVVQHGMDASDDRLSEFRKSVLEVLYEAQCHWNHDVCDHVRWGVFATFHFARGVNALPILVDFLGLNLLNANDHFGMSHDVVEQRQNGQSVFATQYTGSDAAITLVKLTLDGKKVIAEQFGAAGHNA
jgi:hypothetical protein